MNLLSCTGKHKWALKWFPTPLKKLEICLLKWKNTQTIDSSVTPKSSSFDWRENKCAIHHSCPSPLEKAALDIVPVYSGTAWMRCGRNCLWDHCAQTKKHTAVGFNLHSCLKQNMAVQVDVRVGKLAKWSLLVSLKWKTAHIVIKKTPLCTDQCQSHAELQQM